MKRIMPILLAIALLLTGCNVVHTQSNQHSDRNNDGVCDGCRESVIVSYDVYAINDLHGCFANTSWQTGVDELSTYLKQAQAKQNVILLSSGDMWQGSAESTLTKGTLMTEWMNQLEFDAMTLGNHEFDWGEEYIKSNAELAEFPFLAINVYDRDTNQLVDYCTPSLLIEDELVTVGIIGAIGDCYSSISADKVEDVYFVTGNRLTSLVKAEADKLRSEGADFIIYSLHDGYGNSLSRVDTISDTRIDDFYDPSLSNGYVDLVFEAHTHQDYVYADSYGVYHLQGGGDNEGITHATFSVNYVTGNTSIKRVEYLPTSRYSSLSDDAVVEELLNKYSAQLGTVNDSLGYISRNVSSRDLRQLVAELYCNEGVAKWGRQYNIVLGGGYLSARKPYSLSVGDVTYAHLAAIFPFDNPLVLCSIKGINLARRFLDNPDYYLFYTTYGESIKQNIDFDATYYIVVDSYSLNYAPNGLSQIAIYDEETFARDLLADYIAQGMLG